LLVLAVTGVLPWVGTFLGAVMVAVLSAAAASSLPWVRRKLRPIFTSSPPFEFYVYTDIDKFDWRDGTTVHWPEYVVPRSLDKLPAPPDETDHGRWRWAHELGGYDANQTLIRIQLAGFLPEPVVVQSIRAVVYRSEPISGSYVGFDGKGAPISVRTVVLDLDKDPSPVKFWPDEGGPRPFVLSLKQHETEVIDVVAFTTGHCCSWTLMLEYTHAGKRKFVTINNHGRPFETTSTRHLALNQWHEGQWHTFSRE
jgi:hypothetical protein